MEPLKQNISVNKTARYFILGNVKQPVNLILFVLHGYGMNASEFIMQFEILLQPGTLIVAPEGLSRYYKKGFSGDVVASWMTKEDRHHEIEDYLGYLDKVYDEVVSDSSIQTVVLGFSQGTSTASRWVMKGSRKVDGFIIWGGEFAKDIENIKTSISEIWNVIGDSDEYIPLNAFHNQSQYIVNKGFVVREIIYEGKHAIDQLTLLKLWDHFRIQT